MRKARAASSMPSPGSSTTSSTYDGRGEMTVFGQQDPILFRAARGECAVGKPACGNNCVVLCRTQPSSEAAQHFVTQEPPHFRTWIGSLQGIGHSDNGPQASNAANPTLRFPSRAASGMLRLSTSPMYISAGSRHGSAFLLLRLEPLHRAGLGHGLSRLWFDRAAAGYSPDRVDALVWAFSELLVEPMNGEGLYEWYRREAEAAAQRSTCTGCRESRSAASR
jgi:hypothetical protein